MGFRLRSQILLVTVLPALFAGWLLADGTRTWEQSKFEDLIKGTAQGVAIRSAGGLELAPAFKLLATTPSAYIWSIVADREGNVYAAAGSPARVYRITPEGKSTVIFEPQELQVQALAVDKSGAIFAATNPDGKIYKLEHRTGLGQKAGEKAMGVDPEWSSTVYFEPGTKYIWGLILDQAGNLYAATGDHGQIFRVTPKGEHSVFFKSDESHIRVLAFDKQGNLIAGSDSSGLVYRITPGGEGFVLYSAPKKEITALAVDKEGNIYAAGVGEKRASGTPSFTAAPISIPPTPVVGGGVQAVGGGVPAGATQPVVINIPGPGAGASGGSEVYRIATDGSPSRIWSSREDIVYGLAFDPQGVLLAGTGNRGHIFAISGDDQFTDLLKASATQVTAFAAAPNGLYACTSNLGKVFRLGGATATEGSYESDVFDAHIFSRWGRMEFRGAGNVELFARSGNVDNPDRNWSSWTKVDHAKEGVIDVPPARFVQWKAVLHSGSVAPRVENITLNYLPKNVAPDFDDLTVQTGVRYPALPKASGGDPGGSGQAHFDVQPSPTHDRDSIGVKWSVHDDNDDQMVYSIYYRGDGESRWLLLKDNVTDKFYSFDASLVPDGGYTVKVVASDAPSHSPGEGLTAERESARFEVDTTPPQITVKATVEGGQIHVTGSALDSFSPIKKAEFSVDASDWQYVEPVGQLSDAKNENYDFKVATPAAGMDHVVVMRVYDRYDNMNSAKTVVRAK
ncbi:MAG: hypothetical protein ACRD3L_05380 [Terriglobales bacterium]